MFLSALNGIVSNMLCFFITATAPLPAATSAYIGPTGQQGEYWALSSSPLLQFPLAGVLASG